MLKSMLKGACGLAVVFSFASTSAFAEDHIVEIHYGSFLPVVSYLRQGDRLIFQNQTFVAHTITAPNANWTSGAIQPGGTFVLDIQQDTSPTFASESALRLPMSGEFTFDPAPLY